MHRKYHYIGPKKIAERVRDMTAGVPIRSVADVLCWINDTRQESSVEGAIAATFVVDEDGLLRIADRRSEHVACAGGAPVLSAGEMTFKTTRGTLLVDQVTNQSTGYCPEPDSWPAVAAALGKVGLNVPAGFDPAYIFRRCERCGSTSIVKEGVFECAVCSATLPECWNFETISLTK